VRALADEAWAIERIAALDVPESLATREHDTDHRAPPVPRAAARCCAAGGGRGIRPRHRPGAAGGDRAGHQHRRLADSHDQRLGRIEFQNERWRFAHDKLRELLERIPQARRRGLHQRVAETLEQLYPPEQQAAALVLHWRAAGNLTKELEYIRIAGHRYEQLGAYDQARLLYERGLQLAGTPELVTEFEILLGGNY
jgi:tetratricopeptide (TPR) repeat protein